MTEKKLNALPVVTAIGLLIALAALATAVVAIARDGDRADPAPMAGMPGMSDGAAIEHGAMEHMEPLPIDGIRAATTDRGGTPLEGVRRDGALEFTLEARPVWWNITKDQRVSAYAYNGIVPGPVIRVRNGEKVRIRFTNRLPVDTTVHWHGIDVPNAMDGVPGVTQEPIEPGGSFTYAFTARPAGDPDGGGTFLYHEHVDEDRQMPMGLYGTFIIDPPRADEQKPAVDRTLVFSEWTADAETGRSRGVMQMEGMFPNFFTINGKAFPDTEPIAVRTGELVRLRLVNAGQFAHPLHLHGTSFRIVARDGHATTERGLRDTATLESGERADIEFRLPRRGKWLLHCHIGHHLTNDGEGPGGLVQLIEAS
jgi:manganese oxidase